MEEIIVKYDHEIEDDEYLAIGELLHECFTKDMGYDLDQTLCTMGYEHNVFQIYYTRVDGKIVGLIQYVWDLENPSLIWHGMRNDLGENMVNICVSENYRKQGICRRLIDKIIKDHNQDIDLMLSVDRDKDTTDCLVKLYQRIGFEIINDLTIDESYFMKFTDKVIKVES